MMKNVTILFAVLAVVALSAPAFGVEVEWIGGVGDYDVAANWVTDETPPVNRVPISTDSYVQWKSGGITSLASGDFSFGKLMGGGWYDLAQIHISGGSLTSSSATFYNLWIMEVSGTGSYTSGYTDFTDDSRLRIVGSAATVNLGAWGIKWSGMPTLEVVLDDVGTKASAVAVSGNATVQGTLELDVSGYTPVLDEEILILSAAGTLTSTGLSTFTVIGGNQSDWELIKTDGADGTIVVKSLVPEPMTLTLLGVGLVGVILRRKH